LPAMCVMSRTRDSRSIRGRPPRPLRCRATV